MNDLVARARDLAAQRSEAAPALLRLIDALAAAEVAAYMTAQAPQDGAPGDDRSQPAPLPGYQQAA